MKRLESRQAKKARKELEAQAALDVPPPTPTPQAHAQNMVATGAASTQPVYLPAHLAQQHLAQQPQRPVEPHEVCPIFSTRTVTPEGQVAPTRRFDPTYYYPKHFTLNDIHIQRGRYFYLTCPWSTKCPCCQVHMPHYEFPVISIHGACVNDSNNEARGASCVFFGFENRMNFACPLDQAHPQTGQRAELGACVYAVTKVQKFLQKWKRERYQSDLPSKLHTVIIKSDSAYIVNGISEWVQKWKSNGWKNCKGQPVANVESWKFLEDIIGSLEKEICVKFWLVSRDENIHAQVAGRRAVLFAPEIDRLLDDFDRMQTK